MPILNFAPNPTNKLTLLSRKVTNRNIRDSLILTRDLPNLRLKLMRLRKFSLNTRDLHYTLTTLIMIIIQKVVTIKIATMEVNINQWREERRANLENGI